MDFNPTAKDLTEEEAFSALLETLVGDKNPSVLSRKDHLMNNYFT